MCKGAACLPWFCLDIFVDTLFLAGIAPESRHDWDSLMLSNAERSFAVGDVVAIRSAGLIGKRCDDTMSALEDVLVGRCRAVTWVVRGDLDTRVCHSLLDDLLDLRFPLIFSFRVARHWNVLIEK